VHQHDHVVARARDRHDGREIQRRQDDLAQGGDALGHEELGERDLRHDGYA